MHMDPRPPAVAGSFYPGRPDQLRQAVDVLLAHAQQPVLQQHPKALVVPHAGYVYSGPVAASAYVHVKAMAPQLTRVVIIGPAHRVALNGLAAPGVHGVATPLGVLEVDVDAMHAAGVADHVGAHAQEHSLEVQFPFLQRTAPHVKLLPLVAGDAEPSQVADLLEALWGGKETLILISTDLSHFLPYAAAQSTDAHTAAHILALSGAALGGDEACGCVGLNGMLEVARRKGMRVQQLDLRNSGDTAGSRAQVVGYGAFAFFEQ